MITKRVIREIMMMDKVKLKLLGISEILGIDDVALLGLLDEPQERQLIVTCDKAMRNQIQLYMMNQPEVATLYPKVMANILRSQGFQQLTVVISGIQDGEYIAEIVDELSGKHYPIRCSDGILFSIVCKAPIYATKSLMLAQSVPFKMGSTKVGLPLSALSENMLKMSMEKAIEIENYEMASTLRDELNKRHAKNEQM